MAFMISRSSEARRAARPSSMEPQRKKWPLRTLTFWQVLIPVGLLAIILGTLIHGPIDRPSANVLRLSGRIEADETRIVAPQSSRVQFLSANEGDRVEKGELILGLDDRQVKAVVKGAESSIAYASRMEALARRQVNVLNAMAYKAQKDSRSFFGKIFAPFTGAKKKIDEPTAGADPLARRHLWELIRQFAGDGAAILVTTHNLVEAEYCKRLGVMSEGRIVAQGTPGEMRQQAGSELFRIHVCPEVSKTVHEILLSSLEPWRVTGFGGEFHVLIESAGTALPALENSLRKAGIKPEAINGMEMTLEDAVISIVQQEGKI